MIHHDHDGIALVRHHFVPTPRKFGIAADCLHCTGLHIIRHHLLQWFHLSEATNKLGQCCGAGKAQEVVEGKRAQGGRAASFAKRMERSPVHRAGFSDASQLWNSVKSIYSAKHGKQSSRRRSSSRQSPVADRPSKTRIPCSSESLAPSCPPLRALMARRLFPASAERCHQQHANTATIAMVLL